MDTIQILKITNWPKNWEKHRKILQKKVWSTPKVERDHSLPIAEIQSKKSYASFQWSLQCIRTGNFPLLLQRQQPIQSKTCHLTKFFRSPMDWHPIEAMAMPLKTIPLHSHNQSLSNWLRFSKILVNFWFYFDQKIEKFTWNRWKILRIHANRLRLFIFCHFF